MGEAAGDQGLFLGTHFFIISSTAKKNSLQGLLINALLNMADRLYWHVDPVNQPIRRDTCLLKNLSFDTCIIEYIYPHVKSFKSLCLGPSHHFNKQNLCYSIQSEKTAIHLLEQYKRSGSTMWPKLVLQALHNRL